MKQSDLSVSVFTEANQVPEHSMRTFAGIQGYYIQVPNKEKDFGYREFFWSDGQYLFSLHVPLDFTEVQFEQMLSELHPVENVAPYLYSMTDNEIQDVFG